MTGAFHIFMVGMKNAFSRMSSRSGGFAALCCALFFSGWSIWAEPSISDADWRGLTSIYGAKGDIFAMAADAEGNLIVAGSFGVIGDQRAAGVAMWDGTDWHPLGDGLNSLVTALAVIGETIYAGGYFTASGETDMLGVARWDGAEWSPVGDGLVGGVDVMLAHEGVLYAGGLFTASSGDEDIQNIAMWDGTQWSPLGTGTDERVLALHIHEGELHVGGSFTTAGGSSANRVARWDGNQWSPLGGGFPDRSVYAFETFQGELYAGGSFRTEDGAPTDHLAQWDGTNWKSLDIDFTSRSQSFAVEELHVFGDELYAGGQFFFGDGDSDRFIAGWDGQTLRSTGLNTLVSIRAFVEIEGKLYASGRQDVARGGERFEPTPVYAFDGEDWTALGSGFDNVIRAIVVDGDSIYVGGEFTHAGEVSASRIAQWNGEEWRPLGSGLNGNVAAILVVEDGLVVGGEFTRAGGVEAYSVAHWDGQSWSAMGEGFEEEQSWRSSEVNDLIQFGDRIIATGDLSSWNNIAQWDGEAWSGMGSGIPGDGRALAIFNGQLHVGGVSVVGSAHGVARWTGISWELEGGGMNDPVNDLAATNASLIAIGNFTQAGGVEANRIASWDGSTWSAFAEEPSWIVFSVAAMGEDVYISGLFSSIGETDFHSIARWDGQKWSALGSGLSYGASELLVAPPYLHAVGGFMTAGGKAAPFIARALIGAPPVRTIGMRLLDTILTIEFESVPGISGWTLRGGSDLRGFPDGWTFPLNVTEGDPGQYTAEADLGEIVEETLFLQLAR